MVVILYSCDVTSCIYSEWLGGGQDRTEDLMTDDICSTRYRYGGDAAAETKTKHERTHGGRIGAA